MSGARERSKRVSRAVMEKIVERLVEIELLRETRKLPGREGPPKKMVAAPHISKMIQRVRKRLVSLGRIEEEEKSLLVPKRSENV
jgi:hypothetical protein